MRMRKKISNIGKKISYNLGFSLREFSKYKSYSSINKGHIEKYHNSLLLRTMRKSGSHFLHSLIGNYINLQYNRNKYTKRLDHPTLRKVFWSSNKYLIDNTLYTETGFKHFIFEHDFECNYRVAFNAKKLINLYRNPLDIFTSMYYYDFKNREKCKKNKKRLEKYKNVTHPRDMMDILLPEFIYSYKLTKNSKKKITQ